jgi:hypothetical protein
VIHGKCFINVTYYDAFFLHMYAHISPFIFTQMELHNASISSTCLYVNLPGSFKQLPSISINKPCHSFTVFVIIHNVIIVITK